MKLMAAKALFALSFFSGLFFFQNCSNAKFEGDPEMLASLNCPSGLVATTRTVKVLFLVDTSGSNASNNGGPGTDPGKTWRSKSVNDLINKYGARSNFHWGLVTFQRTSATSHINVDGSAGFSNDQAVVQSGVALFQATPDGGHTPYKAALSTAKNMIAKDVTKNASQNAAYAVVMISDGAPSDYNAPDEIISDAKEIMNVSPNQITLNSIFYYNGTFYEDDTKYLKNLSSTGNGAFVKVSSGSAFQIDDILMVPRSVCEN